jgi:hypothetical protein
MANAPAPTEKSGSANHWKDIFDQSLAILCDGANSVPMRRSYLPLRIDAVTLQKRALSSAADALAALWKISETRAPKLRSGAVQWSR